MPFEIIRNDITKMEVDAIVNAANNRLRMGGGVCGAIFEAAGAAEMQAACDAIGSCATGEAVMTEGFALPARHVIHVVGPVWNGGGSGEEAQLRACYSNALGLAMAHGLGSIAFPLISSGIYGYPKDQALRTAVDEIGRFLLEHELQVWLVVFDRSAYAIGTRLFADIRRYIDDQYADARMDRRSRSEEFRTMAPESLQQVNEAGVEAYCADERLAEPGPMAESSLAPCMASREKKRFVRTTVEAPVKSRSLSEVVVELEASFSERLLQLIDEKGMTDVETYKRANLDRKHFSKIRSLKGYNPGKTTAVALAVALRLSLDETQDLLARAGYTLSRSSCADMVVAYFIEQGNHNIFEINEALFAFEQGLLGAGAAV